MLRPVESFESWCEKYDLKPITRTCRGCGKELTTTIPVATRMCRGLTSEPHGCDSSYDLVMLKPIDPDFIKLLNKF